MFRRPATAEEESTMSTISSRLRWVVVLLSALATSVAAGQPDQDPTQEVAPSVAGVEPAVIGVRPPLRLLDAFDRADGPLGADWVVQTGVPVIRSFAAAASSPSASLATHVGGGGAALEADVSMTGAGTSYVALVLEYASLASNLFIKVQSSGTF